MYYSFSASGLQEGVVLLFYINPPMHKFSFKFVKWKPSTNASLFNIYFYSLLPTITS